MKLELETFQSYKDSSIGLLKEKLKEFYGSKWERITISEIKKDINKLNAYPGIENMQEVDENDIVTINDEADISAAKKAILEGKILWEHAAAGEATRLGIGTKYLLEPHTFSFAHISEMLIMEAENDSKSDSDIDKIKKINDSDLEKDCGCNPKDLLPISLGTRHMIQLIFDIRRLAEENSEDPDEIIRKQKMVMILNEKNSEEIAKQIQSMNYFGINRNNFMFMEQRSFHGISLKKGKLFYDKTDEDGKPKNNKRLHNHGQMVMQKLHDKSVFRFIDSKRKYLSREEFIEFMEEFHDMISYNIEDLGYLTGSIDFKSLATALMLREKKYDMVMEVVGQNPTKPQKGASLFFDPAIRKNVMIESFRLGNLKNEDLKLMNKNFNHYPSPVNSLRKLAEKGLPLGFEVKTTNNGEDYIYLCTVQGDTNFLVNTAYVRRGKLEPIKNWKTASQTTAAIKTMKEQDNQKGFKEFAKKIGVI